MQAMISRVIQTSNRRATLLAGFCISLLFLIPGIGQSQNAELGLSFGLSNYQGDLSSYNFDDEFRVLIHPEAGLFGRYFWNRYLAFKTDIRLTGVSGDDDLHSSENRRRRNLDFRTRIFQAYITAEFYLLSLFNDEPTRFNLFFQGGAGIFHFNPETKYMGEWVKLHELHTEGQGLAGFPDQKPYQLTQFHLPVGCGIRYQLNDRLSIGIELTFFYLFTDYLDDVSTIYISYPELLENEGPLSAALANRVGEYLGTEPLIVPTGKERGNSNVRDFFGTGSITIQYALDAIFVPDSKKFKTHCPKF